MIVDDFDYCPICNRVLTSYERNIFYGDFLCEECQKKFDFSKNKIELLICCRTEFISNSFCDYCIGYDRKLLFFFYTNEIVERQEQEKIFDKILNFFKKKKRLRTMKRIGAFLIGT